MSPNETETLHLHSFSNCSVRVECFATAQLKYKPNLSVFFPLNVSLVVRRIADERCHLPSGVNEIYCGRIVENSLFTKNYVSYAKHSIMKLLIHKHFLCCS